MNQGTTFTSHLLKEAYRLPHIEPIRASPYHLQTDGLVEPCNKTLKAMLQRAATNEGKDWDKLIPYLLLVYQELCITNLYSLFTIRAAVWQCGAVWRSLDIWKEWWEDSSKSSENIESYIPAMMSKLLWESWPWQDTATAEVMVGPKRLHQRF